ncbi:MAG: FAD:protein FMN transferase [Candidatus Moraniibacteriota bacterium]
MNSKLTAITTASSIPTRSDREWRSLRQEVRGEIMKTDVACEILFPAGQEALAEAALREVFDLFRGFESRYSRFIEGNELWEFNRGSRRVLSSEFFRLLSEAKRYHEETNGLFDPSILPVLEHEGYVGVASGVTPKQQRGFAELSLDKETLTATKPRELVVDLGGIGKGFIVDQVVDFLSQHFDNFLIDAGGDIFAKGANRKEGYPYWAIEVEHPDRVSQPPALLMLTDMAVATSGINRRCWEKDGEQKHHIIDPAIGQSAAPDFLSVTVVAPDTTAADVWAKSLYIAGKVGAEALAQSLHIPAIFVGTDHNSYPNPYVKPYLWKA